VLIRYRRNIDRHRAFAKDHCFSTNRENGRKSARAVAAPNGEKAESNLDRVRAAYLHGDENGGREKVYLE